MGVAMDVARGAGGVWPGRLERGQRDFVGWIVDERVVDDERVDVDDDERGHVVERRCVDEHEHDFIERRDGRVSVRVSG